MIDANVNTIAKRIQSRLTKLGVKFSLPEIRPLVEQMISDTENPSAEEINKVVDHFLDISTQLTVIDETVQGVSTEVYNVDNEGMTGDVANIDNVNTQSIQSNETGSNQDEIRGNQNNQETLVTSNDLHPNEAAQHTETAPQTGELATTTKNELVASTAVNLGIELSTQDIENIADNFDAGSDDFTQTLEQVKGAIIAYVQHKIASNNQKITNTINEISQVASDGFEENSQTLTNGLKELNQQLVQQSTDFKSKLAGTLARFNLPEAS